MHEQNLTPKEQENLREMLAFWNWMRNLNKFLKWLVYIGAPLTVGIWSIYNWLKKH